MLLVHRSGKVKEMTALSKGENCTQQGSIHKLFIYLLHAFSQFTALFIARFTQV